MGRDAIKRLGDDRQGGTKGGELPDAESPDEHHHEGDGHAHQQENGQQNGSKNAYGNRVHHCLPAIFSADEMKSSSSSSHKSRPPTATSSLNGHWGTRNWSDTAFS